MFKTGSVTRVIAWVLLVGIMMGATPIARAGSPAPASEAAAKDGGSEAQFAWGPIIRGILMGSSALWRAPWFQDRVVNAVRTFSSGPAANAVRQSWTALGRTVDNLIGTERLSWPVVQDAIYRTLNNQGFRGVARQAAVGMEQAFRNLRGYFD